MKVASQARRAIWIKPEDPAVVQIIDQRALPHSLVIEDLRTVDDMAVAIRDMHLRGAPLIGAAAAYGIYLACLEAPKDSTFHAFVYDAAQKLRETRPTAVNLVWALNKMMESLASKKTWEEKLETAKLEAERIADTEVEVCRKIGEYGLPIIEAISARKQGGVVNIMTHCNAGWLACIDWGTATSPIYQAHDKGVKVHVWVSETRPRNQGASLTAWELHQHGVPYTLIADNAAGHLMQHGRVDMIIVGTDRTTRTGDVANKIGTYLKALAADHNHIPFYVAVPSSSIDWNLRDGIKEIPIEERSENEVKYMEGLTDHGPERVLITLPDANTINPGFDVTPAHLITGLITERGISAADEASLLRLFPEKIKSAVPDEDGVIKFECQWDMAEPLDSRRVEKINQVRRELFKAGLIGVYQNGIGYGNLSVRSHPPRNFIITGTQTGGIEDLSAKYFTEVVDYDISANRLSCRGPIQASSESLTHAMIYELDPSIQAVVHVHHALLWRELMNRVPTSQRHVPYGTPEMAREVRRLFEDTDLKEKKIMVMGGHEEGVLTFGKNLEEAAVTLFMYMRRYQF